MWTEPKRPAQPVQQAQTLIQGGPLNAVAAIMVRDNIKPMIALDFIARLGYILPLAAIMLCAETAASGR